MRGEARNPQPSLATSSVTSASRAAGQMGLEVSERFLSTVELSLGSGSWSWTVLHREKGELHLRGRKDALYRLGHLFTREERLLMSP